jgi:gas vesicle protein
MIKNPKPVKPLLSTLAGAVVGGTAVAAAFVLSDKKNQKKIRESLEDIRKKSSGYLKAADKTKTVVKQDAARLSRDAQKTLKTKTQKAKTG